MNQDKRIDPDLMYTRPSGAPNAYRIAALEAQLEKLTESMAKQLVDSEQRVDELERLLLNHWHRYYARYYGWRLTKKPSFQSC